MRASPRRCPLLDASLPILFSANEPVSEMRRLRQDLRACQNCRANPNSSPLIAACPLRSSFNAQMQIAIQAVLDEYAWAG